MKKNNRKAGTGICLVFLTAMLVLGTGCGGSGNTSDKDKNAGTENTAAVSADDSQVAKTAEEETVAKDTADENAAAEKTAAAAENEEIKQYKGVIVIDPGHQASANGEQEPVGPGSSETKAKVAGGTSGVSTGVPEYQLALDIGLKLRDELEKKDYMVIMTRETNDVDISNAERAEIANEADADIFIRIHANGSGSSGQNGAMTICQTSSNRFNGDLYEQSYFLSERILDAYCLETGIRPEYIWETDTMTGINWSRVPVTILEMGYMSNPEEDEKMQDKDMQEKMVKGIVKGIDSYMLQNPPKVRETDNTVSAESVKLSPEVAALKKHLEEELAAKSGKWSLYLNCLETGEKFGINAKDPMISASLIKLYIAGCYFDQIEKGVIKDDYKNQLFTMISESNNSSTNTLIDVLGMDTINKFMKDNGYKAGKLNRKMLEQNGKENYTSAQDCARVLRKIYQKRYVNKEASKRILEAMRAQIQRNRAKIPAGVPEGIKTANKTGELFTTDPENGNSVEIQNDAAIIYAPGNTYILTIMTTVPPVSEEKMRREIADVSAEIFAVCGGEDSEQIHINENSAEHSTGESSESSTKKDSSKKDRSKKDDSRKDSSAKDSTKKDSGTKGSTKKDSSAKDSTKKGSSKNSAK